ncbi:uncharacterized protein [Choristoneura fumiferana]|uniref:uncharacterized protein n=1 Tax=Choristoneura fumiferana TaxID=7141 RepID=UPI003D159828
MGCRETLRQILLKNGFEFKTNQNERSTLIERFEISAWRHKYVRKIAEKGAEGKPIVYMDETYVHLNYRIKKSWQGPSTSGVTEKISPGKRYIIVMDNASYHMKQVNKAPTMQNLKATLREWLCSKNIPFEESFTKAELLGLINENKPLPVYKTEELLNENGHEVLKLPPYHCDLNPIEMIWSLAKRRVASRNMGVPASEIII